MTCCYAEGDGYLSKISAILRLFILFVLTVSQKEYYYIPYENNSAFEVKIAWVIFFEIFNLVGLSLTSL